MKAPGSARTRKTAPIPSCTAPTPTTFPPARGRTGFAIKPYGRFVQYDIAPTDGMEGHPGTWTADGATRLRIHLEDGQSPDYTLELISLKKGVLKVRRL
jgi:hypothetical protein